MRNLKSWILKSQISAKLSRKFYQEPVFTPDDLAFFLKNQGFPERQIPRMKSVMGILGIFSYVKAQFSLMNYQYGTSGFCILVIGSAASSWFSRKMLKIRCSRLIIGISTNGLQYANVLAAADICKVL